MNGDWQTYAALAIVVVTIILFVLRAKRRKPGGHCDDCDCGKK